MEERSPNILPALQKVWTGARAAGRIGGRAAKGAAAVVGLMAPRRPAAPLTPEDLGRQRALLAAVGLSLGAVVIMVAVGDDKKRVPKNGKLPPSKPVGRPLCPTELGQPTVDVGVVRIGDFVIVSLSNRLNTLRESTWARVLGISPGRVTVELVGETRKEGDPSLGMVPTSLKSEWHGFHIGQKLFLNGDCIWDVLHANPQPGVILCGVQGIQAFGHPPLVTRFLAVGFRVRIELAPRTGVVSEPVWAEVARISPTGSVITARILDVPKIPEHGFSVGDTVEFARDCIFGVQPV